MTGFKAQTQQPSTGQPQGWHPGGTPWCGKCDEKTRRVALTDDSGTRWMKACPRCSTVSPGLWDGGPIAKERREMAEHVAKAAEVSPQYARAAVLAKALVESGQEPTFAQALLRVVTEVPSLAARPTPVRRSSPTLAQIQKAAEEAVSKGLAPTVEQALANILQADPAPYDAYVRETR